MDRKAPIRRLAALALLTALIAAPAVSLHAQGAQTILPGYWEYKVKMAGLTVDTEMWCVGGDQIDKFFTGPCNRHHTCSYPVREVAAGKAHFKGTWTSKNDGDTANVEASGDYSPQRFTLKTKPTRGTNGVPIPSLTLDAKWLGAACKPGAKTPK